MQEREKMEYFDNPVGRLYILLSEIATIPDNNNTKNTRMREIWAKTFKIDKSNTEELFSAYIEMLKLLKTAREKISRLPNVDPELHIKPFENLEKAFSSFGFEHQLHQFRRYLDSGTMTSLKFCAHSLAQIYDEPEVDEEHLDKLRSKVEKLINEILDSNDIEYELRVFLVERLEEIKRALLYYRINGTKGLRKALESTIGAMYLFNNSNIQEEDEKNSALKGFMGKMKDVVVEIAKITLAETAKDFLTGGFPALLP